MGSGSMWGWLTWRYLRRSVSRLSCRINTLSASCEALAPPKMELVDSSSVPSCLDDDDNNNNINNINNNNIHIDNNRGVAWPQ